MAFSVIAIHSPEYLWPDNRSYQMGIDWFIRLAVPFFFIASGFAVQKKLNLLAKEEDIRNYLSVRSAKLWRVWAIWLLIYLPLSLWAIYPVALPWSEKFYCYVKDVFMTGSSEYAHHLWFVYSLAIFTSLWIIIKNSAIKLWFLFISVAIITIICTVYKDSFISYNQSLYVFLIRVIGGGISFLAGGLWAVYHERFNLRNSLFMSAVCCLLSLVLYVYKQPFYPLFGGLFLFIVAFHLCPRISFDYAALRKDSMWVYYIHMYVIIIIMVIVRRFQIVLPGFVLFASVCLISWFIARGLQYLSSISRFQFIEKLIK